MKPIRKLIEERSLHIIQENATVAEAARFMAEQNIGAMPVLNGERLVGVFSERDIITRVIARNLHPETTTIGSVMTTKLVVANQEEDYESCLSKMQQARCRHLPIVSGETIVGFLSLRDLLLTHLGEKSRDIDFLTDYLFTIPPGMKRQYPERDKK